MIPNRLPAREDDEPTIGELARVINDIAQDVGEIKLQTIRTNGRVTELEVSARIETALSAERAHHLARESESRAHVLADKTAAEAQTLVLENRKAAARISRRQWLVNSTIAGAGVMSGIAGVLLSR